MSLILRTPCVLYRQTHNVLFRPLSRRPTGSEHVCGRHDRPDRRLFRSVVGPRNRFSAARDHVERRAAVPRRPGATGQRSVFAAVHRQRDVLRDGPVLRHFRIPVR